MVILMLIAIGAILTFAVTFVMIARNAKHDQNSRYDYRDTSIFETPNTPSASDTPKVTVRTQLSVHRIPDDPCFVNVGDTIYHKSRECQLFSEDGDWEAFTKNEVNARGLKPCLLCDKPIAFVYPRARVYHTTTGCSESWAIPVQMFEEDAKKKGYRKCKNCQKRDGDLQPVEGSEE